jgi:hypothetical protein
LFPPENRHGLDTQANFEAYALVKQSVKKQLASLAGV